MQLGLLSDVHSNLHALEAVLDDIQDVQPDDLVFLGDAVGYNAFPQQCVELLERHCTTAVLGNHDEAVLEGGEQWFNRAARAGVAYSRTHLSQDALDYLAAMHEQTQHAGVHLVHGSPRDPTREYIFPDTTDDVLEQLLETPQVQQANALALGHTHVPFARTINGTLICNPGSVGQPRDGDPRAAWALLDTDTLTIDHRRVAYDIQAAAQAIEDSGLPQVLADRLFDGH